MHTGPGGLPSFCFVSKRGFILFIFFFKNVLLLQKERSVKEFLFWKNYTNTNDPTTAGKGSGAPMAALGPQLLVWELMYLPLQGLAPWPGGRPSSPACSLKGKSKPCSPRGNRRATAPPRLGSASAAEMPAPGVQRAAPASHGLPETPQQSPLVRAKHRAVPESMGPPAAPHCQAGNTQSSCPVPSAALVWGGVMATFRDQKASAASRKKLKLTRLLAEPPPPPQGSALN